MNQEINIKEIIHRYLDAVVNLRISAIDAEEKITGLITRDYVKRDSLPTESEILNVISTCPKTNKVINGVAKTCLTPDEFIAKSIHALMQRKT